MSIKITGIEKMTQTQRLAYMNLLLKGQLDTEEDMVANLANASAIVKAVIENLNWAGFYLMKEGELVLGPFQGLPACNRIKIGERRVWNRSRKTRNDLGQECRRI